MLLVLSANNFNVFALILDLRSTCIADSAKIAPRSLRSHERNATLATLVSLLNLALAAIQRGRRDWPKMASTTTIILARHVHPRLSRMLRSDLAHLQRCLVSDVSAKVASLCPVQYGWLWLIFGFADYEGVFGGQCWSFV